MDDELAWTFINELRTESFFLSFCVFPYPSFWLANMLRFGLNPTAAAIDDQPVDLQCQLKNSLHHPALVLFPTIFHLFLLLQGWVQVVSAAAPIEENSAKKNLWFMSSRLCNTNRAMSDPSKRETHSTPISHERSKSRSCLKQSKLFPQILKNLTKQLKQTKHFLPVIINHYYGAGSLERKKHMTCSIHRIKVEIVLLSSFFSHLLSPFYMYFRGN